MKNKILALLLAVAMIVSMLPVSGVVSAATNDFTEDFSTKDKWEDMVATYYGGDAAAKITVESSIVTFDEKSTLLPVQAGRNRGAIVTVPKDENWTTDKKLASFSTTFLADTISSFDNNTSIFVYAPTGKIGGYDAIGYNAVAIQMHSTSAGNLQWHWELFYWDAANSKVAHTVTSNIDTKIPVTEWIKLTVSYDYSKIDNNVLNLSAVFSKADGTEATIARDYAVTFDAEPETYEGMEASAVKDLNVYNEGFKVGIGSTGTSSGARQSSIYFDDFAVVFEKTAADAANAFNTKYADVLEADKITTPAELATVEAAIAEYEAITDDAVKALLEDNAAKLNALKAAYVTATAAAEYKNTYAAALALETVSSNADAAAVITAVNAYAELDDAVKALLTEEIAGLNALKATIKIDEFDFENETLFAEVWESIPETGDIYHSTGATQADSTWVSDAALVADGEDNKVLIPEYRNKSRKRKMLTVKEEYLEDGQIASFQFDVRADMITTWDNSSGIYYQYEDIYNWGRIEFGPYTLDEENYVYVRTNSWNGDATSSATSDSVSQFLIGAKYGEWITVKVDYDYSYTEEVEEETVNGVMVNFQFINPETGELYQEYSTRNSTWVDGGEHAVKTTDFTEETSFKVGVASAVNADQNLMYFDNFALDYVSDEEPVVTPEDLAAEFNTKYEAVLAKDAIGDEDVATVDAAIAEYATLDEEVQTLLADSIAKLNTLKADYETAKTNAAIAEAYETDYADALALEEITSDTELEAVENAIAAYKVLDPAVQAFVTVDIAKYEGLVADYIAAKEAAAAAKEAADAYMLANEAALALETINSPAEYDAVVAAIAAYADLDVAAQALIDDAIIEKLNALKADYDEFLAADYTPVIKGATIRRSGTQTLAFRCAVGAVNARKQVVDCGIIVTASSYIADGYVNSEDLVVDSTNDLVIVAPLEGATNITSGYEFTVNIGNISSRNYGVRYIAKVFVKYSDGTIEYSETATKSVISVAKAIASWTFWNQKDYNICTEYGIADIAEIITDIDENGTITYAYDVTTDNGVKILEYLEANNEAIATAYNALNVQQERRALE